MPQLPIHTIDSAPAGSKPILDGAQRAMGFVPNLLGVFAGAPAALKGYTTIGQIFDSTSFSPTERQVVLLTTSFENECSYCMAAHSVISGMQGVAEDVIGALRSGEALADGKLEALRNFTRQVVRERGWVSQEAVDAFLAAGYDQSQILEVILGVSMKTLSNYVNHLADTPVDISFAGQTWSPPARATT